MRSGRKRAGVPEHIKFATKPEIALAQITRAVQDGVPQGTVLMDAGYGVNTALRDGVTALGLNYVAGVPPANIGLGAGRESAPAKAVDRTGPAAKAHAPRWRASPCIGQGTCSELATIGF